MRNVESESEGTITDPSFDAFFRSEYRAMVAVAAAICGSFVSGEDIAQEALWRASRHWSEVVGLERPGAWVRRVTVNLALNRKRDEHRRDDLATNLAAESAAETTSGSAMSHDPDDDRLWQAMGSLSDDQRMVLALAEVDGYEPRELASILECRPGAARVRLHRAREALRTAYDEIGAS